MKEPHEEGVASHLDPESCADGREAAGEALTGARTDAVSSCEIVSYSGVPTPSNQAQGNTPGRAERERSADPAQSQTRCTSGTPSHGNWEIPRASGGREPRGPAGQGHEPRAWRVRPREVGRLRSSEQAGERGAAHGS
jgi:hypothetical protein